MGHGPNYAHVDSSPMTAIVKPERTLRQRTGVLASADLETVGLAIPVLAVFLPVIGVGYRATGFLLSGHVPAEAAVAQPIPALALTGFAVALPAIATAAFLTWFVRPVRERQVPPGSVTPRTGWKRYVAIGVLGLLLLILLAVLAVTLIWLLLSIRGIPFILTVAIGAGFGLLSSRLGRPMQLKRVIGAVAIASPLLIAVTAIAPNTADTSAFEITFDPTSKIEDGAYAVVGADEDTTWLMACDDSEVVVVRSDLINSRRLLAPAPLPPPRSIPDMLSSGVGPLGYVPPCPGP